MWKKVCAVTRAFGILASHLWGPLRQCASLALLVSGALAPPFLQFKWSSVTHGNGGHIHSLAFDNVHISFSRGLF